MLWLLFAFSGPLFWGVSFHIDKYLVNKYFQNNDTAVLMVFTALMGVLTLPVIWYYDPTVFSVSPQGAAVMMFSGVLYMGAMLFYLRAIQTEEASVVAPLFQLSTVFTFVLGYLFLGELLSWLEALGIILIIIGALSISVNSFKDCFRCKTPLILRMLVCTFIMALAAVLFKVFAIEDSFWTTTFWTFVGEAFFGVGILLIPRYYEEFFALFRSHPGPVIGINATNELINLGGGLGIRYASLFAPVAIISAISSTTTLFVFFFGVLLTIFVPRLGRESLTLSNVVQKITAALLVAIGVWFASF
jgi:drug/metabolite transporter (DMT)-like permease